MSLPRYVATGRCRTMAGTMEPCQIVVRAEGPAVATYLATRYFRRVHRQRRPAVQVARCQEVS